MQSMYASAILVLVSVVAACGGDPAGNGTPAGPNPGDSDPRNGMDLLSPPAPGAGFQVVPDPFEVAPGEEVYYCYRLPMPVTGEHDIGKLTSRFSPGAHHLLVLTVDGTYESSQARCSAGTLALGIPTGDLLGNNLRFIGGTQTPYADDPRSTTEFGEGMAFRLKGETTLLLQLHWANTTTAVQTARTAVNFYYAPEPPTRLLESFFFYHTGIRIPPRVHMETAGRCTFPAAAEVAGMVSHMHARGARFTAHAVRSGLTELVYEETSWNEPRMKRWPGSELLQLSAGDGLEYRCFFENDTEQEIRTGEGAGDEMCMLIGTYSGGDRTLFGFPGRDFANNPCTAVP